MNGLPQKELLRIDEVASYFSVSNRTVRLWIKHGDLAAVKIFGTVRIYREDVRKCCVKLKINSLNSTVKKDNI